MCFFEHQVFRTVACDVIYKMLGGVDLASQPWGDYAFAFRDEIIRGSPRIPCAQVAVLSRPHARSNRHSLLGTITADFCVVVGTSFGRGVIVASYASCM